MNESYLVSYSNICSISEYEGIQYPTRPGVGKIGKAILLFFSLNKNSMKYQHQFS